VKRRSFLGMLSVGAIALVAPIKYLTAKVTPVREPIAEGSVLQVENIWPEVAKYLPDDLVYKISNNRCYNTIHEYNVEINDEEYRKRFKCEPPEHDKQTYIREVRLVHYVGCKTSNKTKGIKKLAGIIKECDEKYNFMKALAPPMLVPLANLDGGEQEFIFLFYAAFKNDEELNTHVHTGEAKYKWSMPEGGMPKDV